MQINNDRRFLDKNKGEYFTPLLVICLYNMLVDCIFIFVRQRQAIYHCNHDSNNEEECLECRCHICFDSYNNVEIYNLTCEHRFHVDCIKRWINIRRYCPICRTYIT